MEDVIRYIESYMDAEYEALRATYLEPSDEILAAKVKKAEQHLLVRPGHIMSLGFGRRPGMSAAEVARRATWVGDFRRRVLFLVRRHHHEKYGDLYACIASSTQKLQLLAYGSCFFVTRMDDVLNIIAHYTPGPTLPSGRTEWQHLDGSAIEDPGELVEVCKLQPPELASHLADYNTF
jgi:hypothetical protein